MAANEDTSVTIDLEAQNDKIELSATDILLDGATIVSTQSPTFSGYSSLEYGVETALGGWGIFSASGLAGTTENYTPAADPLAHASGVAVFKSGSATTSVTFDLAGPSLATSSSFNGITVIVGLSGSTGRLHTRRTVGSNTYSVILYATWMT